jgi:hypothetical protein
MLTSAEVPCFHKVKNQWIFSRIERKRREKEEQETYKLEQKIALWDPQQVILKEQQTLSKPY